MTTFILSSENTPIKSRTLFESGEPADDRLAKLAAFLDTVGLRQLSTTHQCHAVAGPDHQHFEAALAAYGLTWYAPCDPKLITRAVEMLIAAELLDPTVIDDSCLRDLISMGFASESDWSEAGPSCEIIVRSYLAEHYDGFSHDVRSLDAERQMAHAALVGGLLVAMTQARAEWTA